MATDSDEVRINALSKLMVIVLGVTVPLLIIPVSAASQDPDWIDTAMPALIPAPIVFDWKLMDSVSVDYAAAIVKIKAKLPARFASKIDTGTTEEVYLKACHWRRVARMQDYAQMIKKVLFARHDLLYGLEQEDLNYSGLLDIAWDHPGFIMNSYVQKSALLVLDFNNYYPAPKALLEDAAGVVRDPCVSFDGKRIAFAWARKNTGFHIFEINVGNPDSIRQLTYDPPDYKVSDYEPCYLPNRDLVFNSSRCLQGYGLFPFFKLVSNLYIMNKDGRCMRRICFDQAHDCHPSVMSNGRVIYSRWEFLDRNIYNVFGVFFMNPDGTLQNEYFGNQLTWPYAFTNAREIPDSHGKFLAIINGIFGKSYVGDLAIIDPAAGRNSLKAVQLVAPKRPLPQTFPATYDYFSDPPAFLMDNRHFQDPYPLDENCFLVSYSTQNDPLADSAFKLYFMNINGARELLAWDTNQALCQPVPLCARAAARIASQADYSKTTAAVTMTNAYYGTGIDSTVRPGSIKKIRVIALEYRAYPWVGHTRFVPFMATPVARYPGSIESKRILGEMAIEKDGSAACIVPARTPFFIQLIDTGGCMIQSMRSWMTLQPGERFDCYGCHEDKNVSPPSTGTPLAITPEKLEPFYDIQDDYLYYPEHIQPILDAKCVSCHIAGHSSGLDLRGDKIWTGDLADVYDDTRYAARYWCRSYLSLTDTLRKLVNFISIESPAEGLKPNTVGSGHSRLIAKLRHPSGAMAGVSLSEKEMAKLCAWIDLSIPHGGKYTDDMNPEHAQFYEQRLSLRNREEAFEAQNIHEFVKNGGYNGFDYGGTFSASIDKGNPSPSSRAMGEGDFHVRFNSGSRQLVMRFPSAGKAAVIDLNGRSIYQICVSEKEFLKSKGAVNRALGERLPAGMYIVKFKGMKTTAAHMVPIY
jgi:hypothetical protein